MKKSKIVDLAIFAMLGVILLIWELMMDVLPNIHPVAILVVVYTLVYRVKALIPLYVYIILLGVINGFSLWWVPYLYIWLFMWGLAMLIPKSSGLLVKGVLSAVFCALHGISFGILYAPAQAVMFGLDFDGMVTWIVAGLPFDVIHMCGNIAMSALVIPLYKVLNKLEEKRII